MSDKSLVPVAATTLFGAAAAVVMKPKKSKGMSPLEKAHAKLSRLNEDLGVVTAGIASGALSLSDLDSDGVPG